MKNVQGTGDGGREHRRRSRSGTVRAGRTLAGILAVCAVLAAGGCSSTYSVGKDETVSDGVERGIRGEALKVALVIALGSALVIAASK